MNPYGIEQMTTHHDAMRSYGKGTCDVGVYQYQMVMTKLKDSANVLSENYPYDYAE